MGGAPRQPPPSPIVAGDLISDHALALREGDQFEYAAIADRIADLCCEADMPINIALFAPWGSGKSSLFTLIEARLEERGDDEAKLIRYDAWRYGGRALQRNFIAHAARELKFPNDDPEYADYHRGLYENQRRVSLSGPRVWRAVRKDRLAPLVAIALILVAVGLIFSNDPILIGALISTFLAVVAAVIDTGKVEVEQSKPSEDEEFSARFKHLVEHATRDPQPPPSGARASLGKSIGARRDRAARGLRVAEARRWWRGSDPEPPPEAPSRWKRLIFFIDELDRCSAEDIAETLKALRTFLDVEECVFVVAADRDVLEAALPAIDQTTPINAEMPYYSTAGAYLDKIFQHQITLPPLRSRSLAKFARTLTGESGGGIWQELADLERGTDGSTPELDLVLFTLIPSHVHSPRRIKVLLNNYATNVRMARSRLVGAWPERRKEIARLTAFQTEFAEFAKDLSVEPRLPHLLLDPSEAPQSELVASLLERWDLSDPGEEADEPEDPGDTEEEEEGGAPEASPEASEEQPPADEGAREDPDGFMVDGAATRDEARKKARKEASERRRKELRRYLERTDQVVKPLRRDLFYLQSAGFDVGLEDPELAELIEAEATDRPETVIEALNGRSDSDLEGAARLLAAMVGDVLGPEQTGVMTCLMEAVRLLGDAAANVSAEVAGALRTYSTAKELRAEHLVGALRTGLVTRAIEPGLVQKVLDDQRLFEDAERVASVIEMTPELSDEELAPVSGGLARQIELTGPESLRPLAELEPVERGRVMDTERTFEAIGERLDREAEDAAAAEAAAAAEDEEVEG